ncbi:MAG TPA: FtsW/RodA/SpoVE family cell cycle protein, partial [Bryobacteraceae bacterium]
MAQTLKTDWPLFGTVLGLVSFGVLILYSASSIMAKMDPRYHSSWYFVIRQLEWVAISVAVMMLLKRTNYRKLNSGAVAFGAIGMALLLLG